MKILQNRLQALDELDMRLVQELEQDARISYAAIAPKIGISPPTVRKRLNRLVDLGAIMIGAISDHVALGYRTIVVMGINSAHGTLKLIAEQLTSLNRIKYICFTAGRYDILAIALYKDPDEYMSSFPLEIDSILGNSRVEIMLSAKTIKRSWSLLTHNSLGTFSSQSDFTPTELDFSVIRGLEEFPRASAKKLAKCIGAGVPSVRFSLSKLSAQEIVRVICIPDPASFGYTASGITLIKVHPSNLKTLTEDLKGYPSVKLLALTFGAFDCMIWTSFQNSRQMSDFLAKDLDNMPGVIHYETLVVLRMQKRSFTLLSEDQDGMITPE